MQCERTSASKRTRRLVFPPSSNLERARQLRLEGAQGGPPLLHAHAAVRALAAVEQRLVALGVAAEEDALDTAQESEEEAGWRPRDRGRAPRSVAGGGGGVAW